MADSNIDGLSAGVAVDGTEKVPAWQAGGTVSILISAIRTYLLGLANTWTATQTVTPAANSSAVVVGSHTHTTSNPAMDIAQTWNAAGVTFTGWKMNITNTASAAASLLIDWQVGGTTRFQFRRNGTWSPYSNIDAGSIKVDDANYGLIIATTSLNDYWFSNSSFRVASGKLIGFAGTTNAVSGLVVGLGRKADKIIEINSGTAGTYPGVALNLGVQTVAQLTAASTAGQGALAFVSDATATTPRSTVAGTGANKVLVMSDGTNWLIVA